MYQYLKDGMERLYSSGTRILAEIKITPPAFNTLQWIKELEQEIGKGAADLIAGKGIYLNKVKFNNYENLLASIIRDTSNKFYPKGTDSIKAIIDHELGHIFNNLFYEHIFEEKYFAKKIFNEFWQKAKESKNIKKYVTNNLSEYAFKGAMKARSAGAFGFEYREFLAEAWGEYRNSKDPRKAAKDIGEGIISLYNKLFGVE